MTSADIARARLTKKRTRIQEENEERILDAGLEVFSAYGFRGATIDQIAERAGMTKPNLLYYFRRKDDVYLAVLQRTVEAWMQPLEALGAGDDPAVEIKAYLARKLEMARENPTASRLYAMEMMQGAPMLGAVLSNWMKELVDEKAALLRRWSAEGRMAPVDPYHLIFMIWATTQHYADYEVQVRAMLGPATDGNRHFAGASETLDAVFLGGLFRR